jgi:curved DNA-binding protein CbpA
LAKSLWLAKVKELEVDSMAADQAKEIEKLISDKFANAEKGDYYKLLDVRKDASTADVKRAYFALVKRVHPDRLPKLGLTSLTDQAGRLFQILTLAYETLSDPKKKATYDKEGSGATPSNPSGNTAGPTNQVEMGKIAFHKGNVMLNKRAWTEAEQFLRDAVAVTEDNARYWQTLGWAVFCNENERSEKQRLEAARECFEKALELDDEDSMTHYNIGLYWKAKGSMKRCKQAMQRALECKPNFVEAKREIRLMKMRENNEKAGGRSKPKGGKGKPAAAPEGAWQKFLAFLTKPR